MDSPSSCLRWLNLAHLNIVFLRFIGELQISLWPCRTAFPPQSNIMRWDCHPPHLPLRRRACSLGSLALFVKAWRLVKSLKLAYLLRPFFRLPEVEPLHGGAIWYDAILTWVFPHFTLLSWTGGFSFRQVFYLELPSHLWHHVVFRVEWIWSRARRTPIEHAQKLNNIYHCKNYLVKMTTSLGYYSFRVHWTGQFMIKTQLYIKIQS